MSAGYIQLTALGQQDVYLTGEPQVTYFSGVYRRHTPFVLEAYDIPFLGQNVKFGSKSICRIPPQGDLIRGMTLKMILPQLSNAQPITQWYWPIPPAAANVAQFVINSQSNTANVAPFGGITWYSTYNLSDIGTDRWLTSTGGSNGPLSNWVTYSYISNKFTFSNVNGGSLTQVWVRPSSVANPLTNSGVFWGLDPLQASIIISNTQTYGNISYGYTVTNNTLVANFTLEQSGWLVNPTPGLPPAASRTGMFLQSPAPGQTITSAQTQMSLSTWTNHDATSAFTVTTNNKIKIASPGIYVLKVGLGLSSGSMANVAYGTVTNDNVIVGIPTFTKTYDWRVSPNPATPAVFPVSITNPNTNVYIYTGSSGSATLSPNSYVTVNQADDYFLLTSNIAVYQSPLKVPFVSNIENTNSTTTSKATDGSLTWQLSALGTYLVTGVIQMSNGYVTSASILERANTIYTYDMSAQGRDPTFAFSMPIVVTDTTTNYYMNVVTSNTSSSCNLMAGSFFIFNQVGIPSNSTTGTQGVLPRSGFTFQTNTSNVLGPTSNSFSSPLQIGTTDFVSNGYTFIETVSGTSNLQFSNVGTYVLTGAICTADQLTSISIITGNSTVTSPISLGLLPPYTVNIPFRITDVNSSNTIIVATLNGSTTQPNIFSNTFISVYPFAVNTTATTQFSYYDSVGTLAVSSAELRIGGQLIQTLTGEAIELWNDLNVSYENQPALTVLTGKNDTSNAGTARTYYVNLPFYFYGFPELSIPVVALDRQDIEVHVTFNNFSNLTAITSSQTPSLANPVLAATIITEYVYLSQPEIDWFRNNRIDQVITQWQYRSFQLPAGSVGGVFPLDFINPVRELFFVIQNSTFEPYDFSANGLLSLGLSFNGYEAFTTATTDATYLGVLEPYKNYNTFPQRQFYMYSFCENTNTSRPTGFVNFSRIKQILLSLNLDPSLNVARSVNITGINFNILRIENGLAGLMFNSS